MCYINYTGQNAQFPSWLLGVLKQQNLKKAKNLFLFHTQEYKTFHLWSFSW